MIIIFLAAKINKLIIFEYLFLFFFKKLFTKGQLHNVYSREMGRKYIIIFLLIYTCSLNI